MYQIRGDVIREDEETFSISFAVDNGNDRISGATSVVITILVDTEDSKFCVDTACEASYNNNKI